MSYTIRNYGKVLCFLHFYLIILSASIIPVVSLAQNSLELPSEEQIRGNSWVERMGAFALLIGEDPSRYSSFGIESVKSKLEETLENDPLTAEQRTLKLIQLLGVENQEVQNKERQRLDSGLQQLPENDRLSEGYVNYYGDVVAAVSMLHDPRSIDVLLGAITTGSMATRTLITFGPLIVQPLVELYGTSNSLLEQSSAIRVLSDLLFAYAEVENDQSNRSMIREVLMEAASDDSFILRSNAVVGLVRLGDDASIGLVERIAETDPYRAEFANNRYIVREAAKKALAQER